MDESADQLSTTEDEDLEDFVLEEEEEEESYEESESADLQENIATSCDVCDRHFFTVAQYQNHLQEHRTCGIDGCTFTAHGKIVDKHVEMQHSTGLYDKIRNISTPEDIARWKEERKQKYPSKENVERRMQQQEEMIKRGERLRKNKRLWNKKDVRTARGIKRPTNQKKKKINNTGISKSHLKPVSLIDEKRDWNGSLFPFRGTSEVYGDKMEESNSDFDDNEWLDESLNKPVKNLKLTNALGDLMSAYNSEDDLEDEVTPKQKTNENQSTSSRCDNNDYNDDAPVEVKISREPEPSVSSVCNTKTSDQQEADSKNKSKRKKRRKSDTSSKKLKVEESSVVRKEMAVINQTFNKRRMTLLKRLLENDIRQERNQLLQCVRYVVENNYFQKKE